MKIKIAIIVIIMLIFTNTSVAITDTSSSDFENTTSINLSSKTIITNSWEHYPYNPGGTTISFPKDEGKHDPFLTYPVEWWYANFHLIGSNTGTEYGAFVAFFKSFQFRVFSISDLSEQKMYTNVRFGRIFASDEKLDLNFVCRNDGIVTLPVTYQSTIPLSQPVYNQAVLDVMEEQQISIDDFTIEQSAQPIGELGLLRHEYWITKTEGGELLPFQYSLMVEGKAQEEDKEEMQLEVDMHCLKPPMIIGGDGLIELGDGYSYYYSQTKIDVTGTLKVHGITEQVTGYAWIDHQWGEFIDDDHDPIGLAISYEWFSIKLDDFREIMTGDTWRRDTGVKDESYSDGINLFNSDSSFELLENYTITQLDFWTDELSGKTFASKWQITEPSKPVDLIITTDIDSQMMHITKNPTLLQIITKIFPGGCFWEGSCSATGTIGGVSVSGKAYVELTHFWEDSNNNQISQSSSQQSTPSSSSQLLQLVKTSNR